ncbi:MAG: FHA domain-containing protein [Lamprocystis purpurea]|jgi:hypothetical protein|uniref:FHA domain-containing protein n=1 Tax=Lamprocystis purpurea TaxID=61598 RepID=UPI000375096F|nr:FHA domain-containing protein [Lamprocystis purpurea]MBV5274784.1 FHA domain-containing protein [Lamprocystis purpurea]
MAKLTLTFKGRLLAVYRLEAVSSIIGRDPDCAICIDSLAVAPRHARIEQAEESLTLTALDPAHPVFRNGTRVDYSPLADGDLILVGKHTLSVSLTDEDAPQLTLPARPTTQRDDSSEVPDLLPAYLQVQSGSHLGQVIPIWRAVTRLNRIGGHEVIIAHRDTHYILSRIGEANQVQVGQRFLRGDDAVQLTDGDQIEIDGIRCRFFCVVDGEEARGDQKP